MKGSKENLCLAITRKPIKQPVETAAKNFPFFMKLSFIKY